MGGYGERCVPCLGIKILKLIQYSHLLHESLAITELEGPGWIPGSQ